MFLAVFLGGEVIDDVLRNFNGDAGRHDESCCEETMVKCARSGMPRGVRVASVGPWDIRRTDTRVYTHISYFSHTCNHATCCTEAAPPPNTGVLDVLVCILADGVI